MEMVKMAAPHSNTRTMESCGAEFELDMGSCYGIILGGREGPLCSSYAEAKQHIPRNLTVANFYPSKICMHIQ
jgi:hypothetical protein